MSPPQERGTGHRPGDWSDDQGRKVDAERRISDIDAALARLADGTWGTCEVCGSAIGDERLEARPRAVRCPEHQEQFETR